jgi:predicted nucleotidyltransferase
MQTMRREAILTVLSQFKSDYAEQYGILEIGVFGSVARDESREDSDVDICIKTKTPDPFALVHIKEAIEELVHKHVDIVRVREKMNPFLKERIEKEAHYV